jgi:hypothetical protein
MQLVQLLMEAKLELDKLRTDRDYKISKKNVAIKSWRRRKLAAMLHGSSRRIFKKMFSITEVSQACWDCHI